jgi:SAM-dependent methyltransferase
VACLGSAQEDSPYGPRIPRAIQPLVGMLTTKYLLPLGTRQFGDDVVFFNFGYEEDPPMGLPLSPSDEPDRYCIQLYHVTASQTDLTGKRLLEVSCGAGGGASYIMRNLGPASYTGLDLNPASIDMCRERHRLRGLDFVRGNAQNLPFPDQTFDAVINVEASHQYPDFPRFLDEVARVLRPGGHFMYADSRRPPDVAAWNPRWLTRLCGRFRAGPLRKSVNAAWRRTRGAPGKSSVAACPR